MTYFRNFKHIYLFLFFVFCTLNASSQPDPRTLEKNIITIPNDSLFLCYKDGAFVEKNSSLKFLMWLNPVQEPYVVFDFFDIEDSVLSMSVTIEIDTYDKGISILVKELPTIGGCYIFRTDQYCLENNIKIEEDSLQIIIEDWEEYKVTEKEYKAFIRASKLKSKQAGYRFMNRGDNCILKKISNN